MVTDDFPLNVSAVSVAVFIELSPVDNAIWAELIVIGLDEYLLENCTRILLPPRVERTTWRRVLLAKCGEGGVLWGSASCCPAAQVPIQHSFADAVHEAQKRLNTKRTNPAMLVFLNILIFISIFVFSVRHQ
jgi:hypothetical protein